MTKRKKVRNGFSPSTKTKVIEKQELKTPVLLAKPEPLIQQELLQPLPNFSILEKIETPKKAVIIEDFKTLSSIKTTESVESLLVNNEWKTIEKLLVIYTSLVGLGLLAHWY